MCGWNVFSPKRSKTYKKKKFSPNQKAARKQQFGGWGIEKQRERIFAGCSIIHAHPKVEKHNAGWALHGHSAAFPAPGNVSRTFPEVFTQTPSRNSSSCPQQMQFQSWAQESHSEFCLVWTAVRARLELLPFQKWMFFLIFFFFLHFADVGMSLFKASTAPETVTQSKMCGFKRSQF